PAIGRHELAQPRGRLLALPAGARVPDAVERAQRVLDLGGEEQRLVAVHVVGAPLGLEVDLVLVGAHARGGQAALHFLHLAAAADLLPLLGDHLRDARERSYAEVRGESQPETAAAVGAEAIPLAVLLGKA